MFIPFRFTVILSFILIMCACNRPIESIETFDDEGKLKERFERRKTDFAKHGVCTKFFPNGKIEETAHFANDTLNGQRVLFFESGDTLIVEHYQKGLFEGAYRSYHANKALKSEGRYQNGAMNGPWQFYYDNQQLKERVVFVDNEENGPFVEFHENGKIKAKGTYKTTAKNIDGNKEHGLLELYDNKGQLERKMNCELGICRTTWSREENIDTQQK